MKSMNKKFVWTIKYTKLNCLFSIVMLIVSLFVGNGRFITISVSVTCSSIGVLLGHIMRIKSGIKDDEDALTRKQVFFILLLLALVILSIVLIKLLIVDKSLSIILICALALGSGIFALVYITKAIKKNKNRE